MLCLLAIYQPAWLSTRYFEKRSRNRIFLSTPQRGCNFYGDRSHILERLHEEACDLCIVIPLPFLPVYINFSSCGASGGRDPAHVDSARRLATAMHRAGMKLVYGGGTTGLMGEVARTLVSLSGPSAVHGIIPQALVKYEQDCDTTDTTKHLLDERVYGKTTVVRDMHTRKRMMAREVVEGGPGGGFVALSGGYGTLEELMEITTWNQLGIHDRPIVFFNVKNFWTKIIHWTADAVEQGFIKPENACIIVEAKTEDEVLLALKNYQIAKGRFKLSWPDECDGQVGS